MSQFDRHVQENFRDMDKPLKPIKITGEQTTYNFVEECYRFKPKSFELKGEEGLLERADICNIISTNARCNRVEPPPADTPRGGRSKKKGGRRGGHH